MIGGLIQIVSMFQTGITQEDKAHVTVVVKELMRPQDTRLESALFMGAHIQAAREVDTTAPVFAEYTTRLDADAIDELVKRGDALNYTCPGSLKVVLTLLFNGKRYSPARFSGILIESELNFIMFLKNTAAGNGSILRIRMERVVHELKRLVSEQPPSTSQVISDNLTVACLMVVIVACLVKLVK
jgi:hypothetical protein